jgi:2-keto-4-pentenoate hydratase/2-oxohepta-3-ene-1,7-dioic acid hydratase in catechol pathway
MRVCRFLHAGSSQVGIYDDQTVMALEAISKAYEIASGQKGPPADSDNLLDYLPPDGKYFAAIKRVAQWAEASRQRNDMTARIPIDRVEWLLPIPQPNKLLLLAGNYNEHLQEGGGAATERKETFPYVFTKPPTTTLRASGQSVVIPKVSPHHVDWELELCIVMGRKARHVREADALHYVAGYTVVNDISDRQFRPNPDRKLRNNDRWFDWEHGKWHDTFCPCGPGIVSADAAADPQKLKMKLSVNGQVKQNATTGQQIFPVAAVVAFISDIVTLEPGDLIATGTPGGVGHASGTYLQPGDRVEAWIEGIGTLLSPVVAEQ